MWKKLIRLKSITRDFYKKEIKNGKSTSFWFDRWSDGGVMFDIFGERDFIDMGVSSNVTLSDVILQYKKRRHIVQRYNEIEDN